MPKRSSWAHAVAQMSEEERKNAAFGPYVVDSSGGLRVQLELRHEDKWPIGSAEGWTNLTLPNGTVIHPWASLGSEFLWRGHHPKSAHAPQGDPSSIDKCTPIQALDMVIKGDAFAFDERFFILPKQKFVSNSFRYELSEMDPLNVFVGYRGHIRRYPEVLTPGLFRARNSPNAELHKRYLQKSRVTATVIKQRFWEDKRKPLTDLEARGVLQHHYIGGATDILDLSFDVNVAKWFSLNVHDRGRYKQKHFTDTSDEAEGLLEASCVYTVIVRLLGYVILPRGPETEWLLQGLSQFEWPNDFSLNIPTDPLGHIVIMPWNVAPLWSVYPSRQRGFGLRGIYPNEFDKHGSVLNVIEHRYHPIFAPDGWDGIGGPTVSIDGKRFDARSDSSGCFSYLMPEVDEWFRDVKQEAEQAANELA